MTDLILAQKKRKFSVYNLIGWDNFIPEGKTKSQVITEMKDAQKVYLGENNEISWEVLLAPANFNPEKLLDKFTKLWDGEKYLTTINCFEVNGKESRSVIVIEEEDSEAYEIMSAMHSLLLVDQFLHITG